jgi:hypothetical protein
MRIERPSPEALPVVYDDDGRVLSDPNDPGREQHEDEEGAPEPPPLSGRGSGAGAWRDFARQVGLDAEDLPKGEIVAQLRSLGVVPPGDDVVDDDDGEG